MDINSRFAQAAVIAAGIAFLGMCINDGIDDFVNKDRVVTVKGLAEKEVEADKVTWPIPTKELGNDLPELYQRINGTTAKVKAFLKSHGIKDEEISVKIGRAHV